MSARAADAAIDERSSTLALVGAAGGAQRTERPKAPKAPKAAAPPKPPAAAKKGKGKKKEKVEIAMEPALPLAELLGSTNFPQTDGEYYVTTAINYANGAPHMGHAYEALVTDVVARYHRLSGKKLSGNQTVSFEQLRGRCRVDGVGRHDFHAGKKTFMLTGADEHGQKIANTAAAQNITPQELVDTCVARFKALDERLDVAYDDYLRTTSERHKACCRELWRRCAKKGDVFLERYDGWYDERAEQFVKASDAKLQNYKDADGIPLKRTTEECYFFRLGKYAPAVRKHIQSNPDFVQPEARRKDVLKMLDDAEEIEKLSISRTTFDWGVGLPEGFDEGHVRGRRPIFDAATASTRRVRPRRLRRGDGASRAPPPRSGATPRIDGERQQRATCDGVDGVDREPQTHASTESHASMARGERRKNDKNTTAGHVRLDRRAHELCHWCRGIGREQWEGLREGRWAVARGLPRHRQGYCSFSCDLLAGFFDVCGATST